MANRFHGEPPDGGATASCDPPQVLLVGNYRQDRQESMLRFADAMYTGLRVEKRHTELLSPPVCLGRLGKRGEDGVNKWLAYIDKFVIFPFILRWAIRKIATRSANHFLIHICDHSNAMYTRWTGKAPVVVTCHDLLAVRGAMGEETHCPASPFGKILQRWIVRGLARASVIACVSTATLRDVERIVGPAGGGARVQLVPMGLNYAYGRLALGEAAGRLAGTSISGRRFVLHVGSNLHRKNRDGVLRAFARTTDRWDGLLVIAGELLTPELWSLAESLKITERVVQVPNPSNEVLEALYNEAAALLFPSRSEGFGWPIIEAQVCGCPVICSDASPLPEVAGEAGVFCPVDDEECFSNAILRLTNPREREIWVRRGLANVRRFGAERMIGDYLVIYEQINPRA